MKNKFLLIFIISIVLIIGSINVFATTGGTITTVNENGINYTIHTFTNSSFNDSFYTNVSLSNVQILVVAGGAGGGGGGGGAGGLIYNNSYSISVGNYSVIIGAGGIGSDGINGHNATSGINSSFNNLITKGGGAAGHDNQDGFNGGSGGGAGQNVPAKTGGLGLAGQGNNGGNSGGGNPYPSAGGGGAGAVGANSTGTTGGNGGIGLAYNISGTLKNYSCGGGGGLYLSGTPGAGGCSFAGNGNSATSGPGGNATENTGSGGGGGRSADNGPGGGKGGSGIIIIKYPTAVSNTISINSTTPLNLTYTFNQTPIFTFNISSVVGTWNTTLIINGTSYGTNNSINTSGIYSIKASTITAGQEYQWWINATINEISTITEKRNIYIASSTCGTTNVKSCVFSAGSIALSSISSCS